MNPLIFLLTVAVLALGLKLSLSAAILVGVIVAVWRQA